MLLIKSLFLFVYSDKKVPLFKYGVSPNKLYDAYAVGRPVISSVGGLINREIENYRIGVTAPPNSPKKLSESIIDLYMSIKDSNIKESSKNMIKNTISLKRRTNGNLSYQKCHIMF